MASHKNYCYNFYYKSLFVFLLGVVLFAVAICMWLFGWDESLKYIAKEGSGWAQALGSVLAILGGLFVAQKQSEYERIREKEWRRQELVRRYELIGALMADLAERCSQAESKLASGTKVPVLQAEFLKIPRMRMQSIPVLELPDEGFALIFNELLLKLEAAEIAISALQLTGNIASSEEVANILVNIKKRSLEGFYEVTRLRSAIMTEDEKKNTQKSKFKIGADARMYVQDLLSK